MLERNGVIESTGEPGKAVPALAPPTEHVVREPEQGAEQAAQQAAAQARAEALAANAQGKADAHVRAQYVPLDEAEANRKAARRAPEQARTPVDYQPFTW